MSRFQTSSLLFIVLKLGLEAIQDESERMGFAFFFASLFLSDFVAQWFIVYSSYLLDEEPHETPSPLLRTVLILLGKIGTPVYLMSELYVVDHYLAFFGGHPLQVALTTHKSYGVFLQAVFVGLVVQHLHNVLHLFVSAVRIVKLDVRQKNEENAKKAK